MFGLITTGEAKAGPTVVTFDSLVGQPSLVVPDGYGGINWGGQWLLDENPRLSFFPLDNGPGIVSSNFNNGSYSTSFLFVTPQIFDGAFFLQDTRAEGGSRVTFQLFDNNALVASSAYTFGAQPSPNGLFLGTGYSGLVDTVKVSYNLTGGPFDAIAMDLITYGPVPEPSSLLMTGIAALSGLGCWGWKQRRSISV
jgi:hypothetical protein